MSKKNKPSANGATDEGARPEGAAAAEVETTTAVAAPATESAAEPAAGGEVTDQPAVLAGETTGESLVPAAVAAAAEAQAAPAAGAAAVTVVNVATEAAPASNVVSLAAVEAPSAAQRGARERARNSNGQPRYAVRALAQGEAEIEIYDEIGFWGITARQFIADLRALGSVTKITVCINSPGGDVFDGIAIHNALRNHEAEITVRVDGIAASIASVIAMAGDKVVMPGNAMMIIHDPWTICMGDAEDLRKVADALDKMAEAIVASYARKTGMKADRVRALMLEETWLTAQEAVALGFADEVREPVKAAARFDLSAFRHVPTALLPPAAKPTAEQDETERATQIIDLCAVAKLPNMARELIASKLPLDVVRARLTNARATASASAEIDSRVPPTTKHSPAPGNGGQPAGANLTAEIYAARRGFGQPANKRKEA